LFDCLLTLFPLSAFVTKAVVAICVVFVPDVAVGAIGVPVGVGEAKLLLSLMLFVLEIALFTACIIYVC
jgi:hypothetical protein